MKVRLLNNVFQVSILLLLTLLALSCRKKDPEPAYVPVPVGTIVADLDGVTTTFNANAIADTATKPFDFWHDQFTITISGTESNSPTAHRLQLLFMLSPSAPIVAGSYPNLDTYPSTYPYLTYFKDEWTYTGNGYEPYVCKATIKSIGSTIEGTFAG